MRPAQKQNRARGRGNRKNGGGGGGGNNLNRVYDSAGPEGKVRGTPQQIVDKYLSLARDAQTAGDRVTAENFLQHAEHYQRIILTAMGEQRERREPVAHGEEEEVETAAVAEVEEASAGSPAPSEEAPAEPRSRRRRSRRGADTEAEGQGENASDASSSGGAPEAANGSAGAPVEASQEIDGFGTIEPDGGSAGADLLIETEEISRSQPQTAPRRRRNGAAHAESAEVENGAAGGADEHHADSGEPAVAAAPDAPAGEEAPEKL